MRRATNPVLFSLSLLAGGLLAGGLLVDRGAAQCFELVADLNPTTRVADAHIRGFYRGHRARAGLFAHQGLLYGVGEQVATGSELWRFDPRSGSASLVVDYVPGPRAPLYYSLPASVDVGRGPELWFCIEHSLWRSDGTPAGSRLAHRNAGRLRGVVGVGRRVLFAADNRLLAFDGSTATDLGEILPNSGNTAESVVVAPATNLAFFERGRGAELWVTDGTVAGTKRMAQSMLFGELLAHRGIVLFTGFRSGAGLELWRSDGTVAGTYPVTNLRAQVWRGASFGGDYFFRIRDGRRGDELWRTDGTANGTKIVFGFGPDSTISGEFCVAGGLLYFAATVRGGPEIYATDGRTLRPLGLGGRTPRQITPLGGSRVAFTTDEDPELFVSDGTPRGTIRIDVLPGADPSTPRDLTAVPGGAVFAARTVRGDTVHWRTGGTAASTRVLFDFAPGLRSPGSSPRLGSQPRAVGGDTLFFRAEDRAGQPWLYRWQRGAVTRLAPVEVDFDPASSGQFVEVASPVGLRTVFSGSDSTSGAEPWVTDGTQTGTKKLRDIAPGTLSAHPWHWKSLGARVVFSAFDPVHGFEPWVTDGTAAGTRLIADVAPGSANGVAGGFVRFGERLVFRRPTGLFVFALWATDGTAAGTLPLIPNAPVHRVGPAAPIQLGGKLHYVADQAWWSTDGTRAGTVRVASLPPLLDPRQARRVGSQVVFFATGSNLDTEVWSYDGVRPTRIGALGRHATVELPTVSGSRLYFVSNGGGLGSELWTVDPTAGRVWRARPRARPQRVRAACAVAGGRFRRLLQRRDECDRPRVVLR